MSSDARACISAPGGLTPTVPSALPSARGGTPGRTAAATPTQSGTPSPTPTCVPSAGQITTLFASNNFGNPGGANYFDLTVASSPITITALDINTAETVPFTNFRVYVLPGMTFAGNVTNMAL